MDITPTLEANAPLIKRYGNGGFVIGQQHFVGSVLVRASGVSLLPFANIEEVILESIKAQLEEIELLVLGTGSLMQRPAPAFMDMLDACKMPYDIMDTGAACRTFNILLQEGRRAAALLIAV